ncbi:SDR family NAD(P)-dependent oxidoreductase [Streptomyces scabiei]|uniref:SDR family NAD(P)-dependent oxidoreductase n=1 Tax=Streptomyces scabiei TaxID=1930 RepID=UPI000561E3C8|nr:SDR family NAD(P)-dependent oxidoreductase [Streptomyces scabiei]MDX2834430.1 SDR family NAD(P)-dependent oxidoreductase [Streptomyces scabiei]MDX3674077.1 SDR family NAD(P)-dependent oxidoreductase [Streptomyces scabiei]
MGRKAEQEQTVLVTGAANGIGAAIAELAVARGHRVMLTDVDEAAVVSRARGLGPRAAACALDIRSSAEWTRAFEAAETAFGGVDVLVNNAGITHTGVARDLRQQQHRDIVEVNLLGTITGVCTALERMTAQGHGHIVNVCSMTSFLPLPGYATYCASKYGLRAFHHSVAIEERDGPLDFTIVHPPSTRTAMLEQEMADPSCAIAFAEKSYAPQQIARAVLDALATKPVEVVFPPLAGRVQRIAGVFPRLMRRILPVAEARGLRQRERLSSDPGAGR